MSEESTDIEVIKHGAGNLGDPVEAGRKGAAKREENRLARLSSAREHIEQVQLPAALQAFDDLLSDTDPRARRYRFAAADKTLDRMLPTTKHIEVDIRAEVSALVAAFKESS